ncbi:MAG TPA: hypothetical protein VGQ83_12015 [Polyangia bacterium]
MIRPPRGLARAALIAGLALAVWLPRPGAAAAAEPEVPPGPLAVPAASQPLGIVPGKTLQPGEPGYKSPAVAAGWSFGATLLPIIVGGFAVRAQSEVARWIGFGLIVGGQSFGPSAGFWYADERPRFTLERFGLTLAAFGAAIYPLYAYTGSLTDYNSGLAAGLTIVAVVAEAVALSLAAWDMTLLGDSVERHNFKPTPPAASRPRARLHLAPLLAPGAGGVMLGGLF